MAEALWTIDELLAATGGKLHGTVTRPLTAVTIDSRAVGQGDIFVAIKGDKHDGHDFVANALKAGAGLGLVSRVTPEMLAVNCSVASSRKSPRMVMGTRSLAHQLTRRLISSSVRGRAATCAVLPSSWRLSTGLYQ